MPIQHVNASHFGGIENPNYPQVLLEHAFTRAFADPLEGSVAFTKVKEANIQNPSNEAQWVAGMNSIITQWNGMSSHTEASIRKVFNI